MSGGVMPSAGPGQCQSLNAASPPRCLTKELLHFLVREKEIMEEDEYDMWTRAVSETVRQTSDPGRDGSFSDAPNCSRQDWD